MPTEIQYVVVFGQPRPCHLKGRNSDEADPSRDAGRSNLLDVLLDRPSGDLCAGPPTERMSTQATRSRVCYEFPQNNRLGLDQHQNILSARKCRPQLIEIYLLNFSTKKMQ
jgi:hypothetical protein